MNQGRALVCSALLLVCLGAQGQDEAKPHRSIKGLPRYMTDIPQPDKDFSITLERIGCVGSCPDYKITIRGNGTVRYEGHAYVSVEGIRNTTVPVSVVQSLQQKLRDEDFLHWPEQKEVCVDFPEVSITATFNGQRKQVLEGCNQAGRVLQLASEIDRTSGAERWTGKRR